MVIKVYISGICGSQDIRKQQQRVLFILSMLPLDVEVIDVTEPGREEDRTFMQEEVKKHDKKVTLPPQIFNNKDYCGDYDDFQLAADDDVLMSFLKLEEPSKNVTNGHAEPPEVAQNGISHTSEISEQAQEAFAENVKVEEELAATGESDADKLDIINDDVSLSDTKPKDSEVLPATVDVEKKDEAEVEKKTDEEEESEEESSEEEESEEESD